MARVIHKGLAQRFAGWLAQEREKRQLSQEAFAAVIGVSQVYVNFLEKGQRTPTIDMVEKIAHKLGYKDPAIAFKERS